MAKKRTADELRKESAVMLEKAKQLEKEEDSRIGARVRQVAKRMGKSPEDVLALMEEKVLTSFPQLKCNDGKGLVSND